MAEMGDPNKDTQARAGTQRRRRTAIWVWLLLVIVAAATARWYVWPKAQALWADFGADAADVAESEAPSVSARVDDGAQAVQTLQSALDTERAANESVLAGLRSSVLQLQQQVSATNSGEGRIAEVEHLLQMAAHYSELARDPLTALRLLGAADALLVNSGDSRLLPVRAALAVDVANLRTQAAIDLEATHVALSALSTVVPTLTMQQPELHAPASERTPTAEPGFLQSAFDSLRGLVRIRTDRSSTALPVLTSEGQALVRERIMLALDAAGLAVLRGEERVYHASVARAEALVRQHAAQNHPVTRQLLQALARLAATSVMRTAVHVSAVDAMAQVPRMPVPGLLPAPESFGAPLSPPLEGVAQTLPAPMPSVAPAVPARSAPPAALPSPGATR